MNHNTDNMPNGYFDEGKLYHQRAKLALPILVRQVKARQPIYYSDLASEIKISNPRMLNYPLGTIGDVLKELGTKANRDIPQIQAIVINKSDNLPGDGIDGFIVGEYRRLSKSEKRRKIDGSLENIYDFGDWDWVLQQLGLSPVVVSVAKVINTTYKGGGESEHHKKFKEFISKNPKLLGLSHNVVLDKIEYNFSSGDAVDVMFKEKSLMIAVEVKSDISNHEDILRGIFQCVKYKALIEAEQIVDNQSPNAEVILALQGDLPDDLVPVKNVLGINVISNIKMD